MAETVDHGPLFSPGEWYRDGQGPRYRQLHRHIAGAIERGALPAGAQLPPERVLADLAHISRVTVRKAVARLVSDGLLEQRQGAGSFVTDPRAGKVEQSLSTLVSFSENMAARGLSTSSQRLEAGRYTAHPDEIVALGLRPGDQVARVRRLRLAGDTPIALETSSLPLDILPRPEQVTASLYEVLRASGRAPTRAIQRVSARNALGPDAARLRLEDGTAVLRIERTGYLASGRPIEFTSGLYRSDVYDFVSEVGRDASA